MSENTGLLNKLRDRRLECWEKAKAVAERAVDEEREMTAEENRQFEEWDSEQVSLDTRIQAIVTGEKRAQDTENSINSIMRKPVSSEVATRGNLQLQQVISPMQSYEEQDSELRRFLSGEVREFNTNWPNAIERRATLVVATGQAGSAPLPTSFIHQLYVYLVDTSSVRQAGATIITTNTGENVLVPYATGEGSASWTSEGGTLTASDPGFSSATLGSNKLGKLIQVSKELATDVGFDLVGYLAQSAGRNIGIASNAAYVSATASGQPKGLLGTAKNAFTVATGIGGSTGFPTATAGGDYGTDMFIDLYHSLLPQYRPRASWMLNDAVIKAARKLRDTIGRYLWEPSLQAGVPDTILGKPVYANPAMPTFTAVSQKVVAFGDFSAYYIRDVSPLRFERSDEFAFGTDLISFRALMRTDGVLVDPNAVQTFTTAAS